MVEVRDVAEGLWLWRQPHPDWAPHLDWEAPVSSFCVTSRGQTSVLDALAPPEGHAVWERLDAARPGAAVILKPDHVRDARVFHDRYGATVYGYMDIHFDELDGLERFEYTAPGLELPGGLLTLDDGRWRLETPLYLPEQRAVVFADGLMADPDGVLRVWETPFFELRAVPALHRILDEHEIELVLVSHGEPVHTRDELEAALSRQRWNG